MMTVAIEDYVRAIYLLQLSGKPYVSDVAKYLGVSKPSASEMAKRLAVQKFLVRQPYAPLKLSAKGVRLGEKLTYKHRIIESFLNQVVGVPKKDVHAEAHVLEHAVTDTTISRMRKLLRNPVVDPHGNEIPLVD